MSKPDAYDQFLAEVLAGVSDSERAVIEGTLKNEALAPKIRERVLARSDYSRQSDALRQERERFNAEASEARRRIEGWQNWYQTTAQQVAQLQKENEVYKSQFGDLENTEAARPRGLTAEEVDQRFNNVLSQRDSQAIAFADALTEIKLDHRETFKEKLDTNALVKFATERGLPIDTAYREFIAPRVEEKRQADVEERIKAAREEGRKAALSEHRLPIVSDHGEIHTLDQIAGVGKTSRDRVSAAVQHWNEQGSHSYY